MPVFDITDHALLSDKASKLEPAERDAHAEVAEHLLGIGDLSGVSVSSREETIVQNAIARQVNLQVELGDDLTSVLVAREKRGLQEIEYRGGVAGDTIPIDPVAVKLVAQIAARGWSQIRSVR
jgi:hypothetical protein